MRPNDKTFLLFLKRTLIRGSLLKCYIFQNYASSLQISFSIPKGRTKNFFKICFTENIKRVSKLQGFSPKFIFQIKENLIPNYIASEDKSCSKFIPNYQGHNSKLISIRRLRSSAVSSCDGRIRPPTLPAPCSDLTARHDIHSVGTAFVDGRYRVEAATATAGNNKNSVLPPVTEWRISSN
jgi:hypothetical protein